MARDGSGTYSLPAGSTATDGNIALAATHNTPIVDLAADANVERPVVAGGTGASTAAAARDNLNVTAEYAARSAGNAADATLHANGTTVIMAGYFYKVDSTKTGANSVTNDLSVDGLVPAGPVYCQHFGCAVDGSTSDTTPLLAAMAWCDTQGTTLHINGAIATTSWSGRAVAALLKLRGEGIASITFTTPSADVFSVSGTAPAIDCEGIDFIATVTTHDLFTLGGLSTNTMSLFRLVNCSTSGGFGYLAALNTTGTITRTSIEDCSFDGSRNGFKLDCLHRYAHIRGNVMTEIVNSTDELMYGFRIGKDAAAGYTNQVASSFIHIHDNRIDRIESTAGTQTSNGVNAIATYGERIIVENNNIEDVISTKTTDVEGIYSKSRNSITRGNILKNGGTSQGTITVKGVHPDGGAVTAPVGDVNLIEGNVIDGGTVGIYWTAANATVRGNIVRNTTNKAFYGQNNTVDGFGHLAFVGNMALDCAHGATIEGGFESLFADDNRFYNLSKTTGDLMGILLDFASAGVASGPCMVSNTLVDGATTQTSDNAFGIAITTGTNMPALIEIAGANISSVDDQPIRIGGAVDGAKVKISGAVADTWFGEINSGNALLANFEFEGYCHWSEATNTARDLLAFFLTDNNVGKATAHVTVDEGATEWAIFDLTGIRSKAAGVVTLEGTDVDTEILSAAQLWDASINTRTANAEEGLALTVRSNDVTPTLTWRASIQVKA